jgi:acyl-CoA thioesterase
VGIPCATASVRGKGSMTGFGESTSARRTGDGRYEVELDPGYTPEVSGVVHGGYLVATMLRAVLDASPYPDPVATSAHFLRPGVPGPAEVRLENLRTGRTVATTRASVVQGGHTILSAQVTTATLDGRTEAVWTSEPPRMPPIEECVSMGPADPLGPGRRFLQRLDLRFDPAAAGWMDGRTDGVPEIRAYFRLREDYPPDAFLIAFAVDAKPPAPMAGGHFAPPVSTVELTLHLRAVPAEGWLTLAARSRLIHDDWFDDEVEVWDSAGRLVALSRQLGRIGGTKR